MGNINSSSIGRWNAITSFTNYDESELYAKSFKVSRKVIDEMVEASRKTQWFVDLVRAGYENGDKEKINEALDKIKELKREAGRGYTMISGIGANETERTITKNDVDFRMNKAYLEEGEALSKHKPIQAIEAVLHVWIDQFKMLFADYKVTPSEEDVRMELESFLQISYLRAQQIVRIISEMILAMNGR